jgi:hypothetical protein
VRLSSAAESDHWRFLLVSHMIDSEGPRWVYQRLMRIFSKFRLPAIIRPLDIVVASPRQIEYRNFPIQKDYLPGNVTIVADLTINDAPVDYMALYRMNSLPRNAGERTKAFDRRVDELTAA